MKLRIPAFLRRADEDQLRRLALHGTAEAARSTSAIDPAAGRPLELGVRKRMERALGAGLGDVRVHTGEGAASEVRRHGAEALAIGQHVAFERGRYRPGTPLGDALLAHELSHTLQQRDGDASRPGASPGGRLEADANRSALAAVGALWGGASRAVAEAAAGAGPRLRSGTQMQFFFCESDPAYKAPDFLGPESLRALEDINGIVESGEMLQHLIVFGTVATIVTSTPAENLASGSYDVTPQAEALRGVPAIVRGRVVTVITLLLVSHENDMNEQERQFWRNIMRNLGAL